MKQRRIKIQLEFHKEIAKRLHCHPSFHFATSTGSHALQAVLLPTVTRPAPSQAWHNNLYHCCGNHDNSTISRAVPVPVPGPARGRLGSRDRVLGRPAGRVSADPNTPSHAGPAGPAGARSRRAVAAARGLESALDPPLRSESSAGGAMSSAWADAYPRPLARRGLPGQSPSTGRDTHPIRRPPCPGRRPTGRRTRGRSRVRRMRPGAAASNSLADSGRRARRGTVDAFTTKPL
jgi:hypothetical protein